MLEMLLHLKILELLCDTLHQEEWKWENNPIDYCVSEYMFGLNKT